MYVAPGFTLVACETVDEGDLRSWAAENGGLWHPLEESHCSRRPAHVEWDFGQSQWMEAQIGTLSDEERAEWTPLMHKPLLSVLEVEFSEPVEDEERPRATALLGSMFTHWDGYAYDIGMHEWVSELLRDLLPEGRIIRYNRPPPGPPPAWVWINGIYQKRPLDDDRDTGSGAA